MNKAKIDLIQEKQIRLLFYLVATLGAVTTVVLFFQNSNNRKDKRELVEIEKELKSMQLAKLKREQQRQRRN